MVRSQTSGSGSSEADLGSGLQRGQARCHVDGSRTPGTQVQQNLPGHPGGGTTLTWENVFGAIVKGNNVVAPYKWASTLSEL